MIDMQFTLCHFSPLSSSRHHWASLKWPILCRVGRKTLMSQFSTSVYRHRLIRQRTVWRVENLLMKSACSSWSSDANNPQSLILALLLSSRVLQPCLSTFITSRPCDVQLNSAMHLITATLHSTRLPWLPETRFALSFLRESRSC